MRGLAFPTNAPVDREPSYEYGTPISNVDDIPIDPALGGAAIDPALMMEPHPINVVQLNAPQVGVQRDASWSLYPKLRTHFTHISLFSHRCSRKIHTFTTNHLHRTTIRSGSTQKVRRATRLHRRCPHHISQSRNSPLHRLRSPSGNESS
jgi:hypothetical protein